MSAASSRDLRAMLTGFVGLALETAAEVLEARPELAARVHRALVPSSPPTPQSVTPRFMSIKEYAAHARLSDRTIRHLVKSEMEEGIHFHRDGRTGRRVIIHVAEADTWRESRSFAKEKKQTIEDLATNEVLRRRAQVALKKAGLR